LNQRLIQINSNSSKLILNSIELNSNPIKSNGFQFNWIEIKFNKFEFVSHISKLNWNSKKIQNSIEN